VGIPVLGIVENMSSFICPNCRHETQIFDHGGARKAAERMGIRFLGEIPLDLAVREGGDAGIPVVEALPDGPQARAFLDMAGQVAGAISVQVMKAPRLPVIGSQPRA
jgi:ATP-binding protein involved in chromosome partitioning